MSNMSLLNTNLRLNTPFVMVIFGASGDLTRRKLVPAIYDLFEAGFLPDRFVIVGYARRGWSRQDFVREVSGNINDRDKAAQFLAHFQYQQGDFTEPDDYQKLSERLNYFDAELGQCGRRLYYLATPAESYSLILTGLSQSGLNDSCGDEGGWTRVVVEKPFGRDLVSARKLDVQLAESFSEDQIYRIDHYLAKETAQNIMTFRFANSIFEPIWNAEHIERIDITVSESIGVGTRGAFYDATGAIRDVLQNHLLQLLALTTMDKPASLSAAEFRQGRAHLLSHLELLNDSAESNIVLGQYQGYQAEPSVDPKSDTETFVAVKMGIDLERWRGLPVYLMTGKMLQGVFSTIKVTFKRPSLRLFGSEERGNEYNVLTFNIQPDEGIMLDLVAKEPGYGHNLQIAKMHFDYRENFSKPVIDAYSRLILDAIDGDQTLFTRADEIEAEWKFVDQIYQAVNANNLKIIPYKKGSQGPEVLENFLA